MPIWFSCPCGQLLVAFDEQAGRRGRCRRCEGDVTVPAAGASPPPREWGAMSPDGQLLIHSGDIERPYEILGSVAGCGEGEQGILGAGAGGEAYRAALVRLQEAANGLGADAVVCARVRVAVADRGGPDHPVRAYEVFAWGMAVRLRDAAAT